MTDFQLQKEYEIYQKLWDEFYKFEFEIYYKFTDFIHEKDGDGNEEL